MGNTFHKINKNPEVCGYRNNINRTTSYFITNFPEDTTAEELWSIFNRYRKVGEVYIPDKRDRVGKRFGFARFEDVEDQQRLLQRIEETWIGTYKIRANLPKFRRGEERKLPPNGSDGKRNGAALNETKRMQNAILMNDNLKVQHRGQTFKEAVLGGGKHIPRNKQNEWIVKANGKRKSRLTEEEYRAGIMAIETEAENLKQLEGSFVGTLTKFADAKNIQVTLWMEGFQQIKARFLGMDLILLTSTIKDEIQRAYESNKGWWERRFISLTPWRPNILPNRRRTWVRLFRVPLHIWSFEGFKKIIWRYGKLMNLDRETSEQTRFDVARAQIEVSYWEMVDEVIEVKVEEEIFIIRMVEERFGSIDVGIHKDTGSNVGVGESDGDSNSRKGFGDARGNEDERWLQYASDDIASVNGGDMVEDDVVCTAGKDEDSKSRKGIGEVVVHDEERDLEQVAERVDSENDGAMVVLEEINTVANDNDANPGMEIDVAVGNDEGRRLEYESNGLVSESGGDMAAEEVFCTVGIDHRIDTVVSTRQQEDREIQIQKVSVQVGAEGLEAVDSEGDGEFGGCKGTGFGSGWEHVKETQEPRVAALQLGSQGIVTYQEVGDEVDNPDIEESGAVLVVGNGLHSTSGPSGQLGQMDVCAGGPQQQLIPISNIQVVINEGELNRDDNDHIKEVLRDKLKALKVELKKWNREVYGTLESKIPELTSKIESGYESYRKGMSGVEPNLEEFSSDEGENFLLATYVTSIAHPIEFV
ncbi:hypothetical protein TSUD_87830 [Trifolium subterraneum]|uniref:RRM domain-containing protein n=1 Tax=Trifolium subterraneum TaxID=3900 RepID=A0A2Z6PML9_TRISU|nr:hypothetical protein TSUD_87830 [Trifolium subterraneum]